MLCRSEVELGQHDPVHTRRTQEGEEETSRDTNLTEPTVGGHDLLSLILKHRQAEGLGMADNMAAVFRQGHKNNLRHLSLC